MQIGIKTGDGGPGHGNTGEGPADPGAGNVEGEADPALGKSRCTL